MACSAKVKPRARARGRQRRATRRPISEQKPPNTLGAPRPQPFAGLVEKFGLPGNGKLCSTGSNTISAQPCAPCATAAPAWRRILPALPRKSPISATFSRRPHPARPAADRQNRRRCDAPRPPNAIASRSITSAERNSGSRQAIPTRSPPRTQASASASASTRARSALPSAASCERKFIDGDRSAQSHNTCAASHSRSRT